MIRQSYKTKGYEFTLRAESLTKDGNIVCIYEGLHTGQKLSNNYEVVVYREATSNGFVKSLPRGTEYLRFPTDKDWGKHGFSYTNFDAALNKMTELRS